MLHRRLDFMSHFVPSMLPRLIPIRKVSSANIKVYFIVRDTIYSRRIFLIVVDLFPRVSSPSKFWHLCILFHCFDFFNLDYCWFIYFVPLLWHFQLSHCFILQIHILYIAFRWPRFELTQNHSWVKKQFLFFGSIFLSSA